MKATNLAICIPSNGCDKNCPYCISKMTGYTKRNIELMKINTHKVIELAKRAGVTSVLLTGKGEPFLNLQAVRYFVKEFRDFPIEIQTNGLALNEKFYDLENSGLPEYGSLSVFAFSLDKLSQFEDFSKMFNHLHELGMIIRVTMNVTDYLVPEITFDDLINRCIEHKVTQFSLRNVVIPNMEFEINSLAFQTADWIHQYVDPERYESLVEEMKACIKGKGKLLRTLPYGPEVYDYKGIAVTSFDYCVQDSHKEEDIRSLIFDEDGHLYTAWNSRASILF